MKTEQDASDYQQRGRYLGLQLTVRRAMKSLLRWAVVAGTTVLALSCASTGSRPTVTSALPAAPSAEEPVAGRHFNEVRALWVIRYDLASPAAVREMVERAAASGFNTLIVQVRGRGDTLYRSALEPPPEFLQGQLDFDALQLVVDEAHALGMAVHAWVNAYLAWGPVDLRLSIPVTW